MKVLFFMSHGVLARNFEWALREFLRRGHRVHVALDHLEKPGVPGLNEVLESLARDESGFTFARSPQLQTSDFATAGRAFRLVLDYLRYFDPGYRDAGKARARLEAQIPSLLRIAAAPLLRSERGRAILRRALAFADEGVPVRGTLRTYIEEHRPNVIVVTPLVDPGSPQAESVRCARELGVPSVLAVHSWDNLTLKGGIHTVPDAVAVWNEVQLREAVELHGVPRERVVITGAPAYDHWFDWKPTSDRAAFCESIGLDSSRPYILYLGSSAFIAPDEGEFVREWAGELRRRLPEAHVLVRPHPLNAFTHDGLPLDVVVTPPAEADPMDDESRSDYFDSIAHSAAVVGVLTSGMVEAAILGRSVHVLADDRYADTQRETLHFGYLLPENGGILHVARDYDEHVAQLRAALVRAKPPERNSRFVSSFIRPLGTDRPAAVHFADAVEQAAGRNVVAPRGSPKRRVAARAVAAGGRAAVRAAQIATARRSIGLARSARWEDARRRTTN
jgi:hypothetical protein